MRINWLAVIISAIIIVLLRRVWYAHFGGADVAAIPAQIIGDLSGDPVLAGKELVNALILSAALGWVIDAMRNRSLLEGIVTGLGVAIGFGLTSISAGLIHGAPLDSFLIDGGFLVASYLIAGAILGATAPKRVSKATFDWGGGSEAPAER